MNVVFLRIKFKSSVIWIITLPPFHTVISEKRNRKKLSFLIKKRESIVYLEDLNVLYPSQQFAYCKKKSFFSGNITFKDDWFLKEIKNYAVSKYWSFVYKYGCFFYYIVRKTWMIVCVVLDHCVQRRDISFLVIRNYINSVCVLSVECAPQKFSWYTLSLALCCFINIFLLML